MTSPSPDAGLVERLRPRHTADEPLARAVTSQDQEERRRVVTEYLLVNNALKSEAADRIKALTEPAGEMREVTWVPRSSLDKLHGEGSHVGTETVIYRKPLKSGNGIALIRLSDHQRAVAERDAEIERLTREVEMAKEFIADEQRQNAALTDQSARISTLEAQLLEARDELNNQVRKLGDEIAIVDRVWAALGVKTYEDAGGKEISELVREWKASAEALQEVVNFVWRWTWYKEGNGTSDAERLSAIKHHPGIASLNKDETGGAG